MSLNSHKDGLQSTNNSLPFLTSLQKLSTIGKKESLNISEYLSMVNSIVAKALFSYPNVALEIIFNHKSYQSDFFENLDSLTEGTFELELNNANHLVFRVWTPESFRQEELLYLDTALNIVGQRILKKITFLSLRESEERLSNLVNSQTNFVLRTDLLGQHTYWNQSFDEEFGWIYGEQGLEGGDSIKSICEYHHERTYQTVTKCIQNPGTIHQIELDKPGRDREIRTTLWEFVCLTDLDGNPSEIQCMGIDISDRVKAEQELKYSEYKYKFLFDNSPNGFLLLKEGKFIECNRLAIELIGGTSDDLIGKTPLEISPKFQPDGKPSELKGKEIIENATRGHDQMFEWVHLKIEGTPFIVDIFLSTLVLDGEQVIFIVWKDITEQKQSEEKLRKLSMAVEQNPLSIVITNLEGNIEYVNSSTYKVTGYEPHELLGKNPRILKSRMTSPMEHEELWRKITQGETWKGILHNLKKNGELYTEKAIIGPIIDERGKTTHYLAIKEDITEKIRTEQNLAISEERFRQVAEQSHTVIWEVDMTGMYTYVNPVSESVFGYSPSELVGHKYFYDIYPEELQKSYKEAALALILKKETVRDFENPIQRKDGVIIWVSTNGTPIFNKNNEVIGYRGSDSDITERKTAEKEIKEQNDRLNAIISANPDLIFILTKDGVILAYYANSENDLMFPPDKIEGLNLKDIFGEEKSRIHYKNLYECHEFQQFRSYEYDLFFEEKLDYFEARMVPMTGGRILAFIRNISDRVKAELGLIELNMLLEQRVMERTQELEEARKEAESANLAKSEFLSRMSHELRTPMNSILGFAQLLEMGDLSERQSRSIAQILKSGRHLLDLINEILDIAKIDAGKISLSLEPVQIRSVIDEMIEAVSPLAMKKNIHLQVMSECGQFDNYIFADKQRVKQILLNLINNAIKYNYPNGNVWIGCKSVKNDMGVESIGIFIKDDGFGIDSNDFIRIFNPFERVNSSHTEIEGTGLGLAVVKKLVDVMNGTIHLESEVGKGSTFTVEFKKVSFDKVDPNFILNSNSISELNSTTPSAIILYVEDNFANLELIQHVLHSSRPMYKIVSTIYGMQALQLAKEYQPNLILLDLNLPDVHGSEVIQQLKRNEFTKHIPVIVISADAITEQVNRLMSLGAVAYLTKPIDIPNFLVTIDQILSS